MKLQIAKYIETRSSKKYSTTYTERGCQPHILDQLTLTIVSF